MNYIFDLDQTLIDSSELKYYRDNGNWRFVFNNLSLIKPYPHIDDFVQEILNGSSKTAIVTSSPSNYCKKILDNLNWRFDTIVSYHDTIRKKPDPEPIKLAIDRLKIRKSEFEISYSFGDNAIDIIASKRAGLKSVGCTWGSSNVKQLLKSNPDIVINCITEFKLFSKEK